MKKFTVTVLVMMFIVASSEDSHSAHLEINIRPVLNNIQHDGEHVGNGQIVCSNDHSGFHIYGGYGTEDIYPWKYNAHGKSNPYNKLTVRLEGDNWIKNEQDYPGIVKFSSEEAAEFRIVIDGKQKVPADEYTIR
ncbi:TPA: AfaD family invasin, partial [Escherichia coli]